jgi:cell division protein FtsQ
MRRALNISLIALAVLGLLVSLGFSVREIERIECKRIHVEVDHRQGNFFLTNEDVKRMVLSKGDSLVGRKLSQIPIASYERFITAHPSVKRSEVFTQLNGNFTVKVYQREPLLRIFNLHGESFYLDRDAQLMPTSANYTARVPVATGFIHDRFTRMQGQNVAALNDSMAARSVLDDLFTLSDFIMKDEFWCTQVQQIKVEHNGEFTLIPTVGDHHVLFGRLDNMEQKFQKLLLFYRKGLNTTGWDQYSHINLKYRNQVICTRKPI